MGDSPISPGPAMRRSIRALYARTDAETMPPDHIFLHLYRQAITSARQAAVALEAKDVASSHQELVRGQAILFELQAGLNRGAEPLATSLEALYDYFRRRLVDANVRKDPRPALEVADLMTSLLEAWEAAAR